MVITSTNLRMTWASKEAALVLIIGSSLESEATFAQ